jgi:hypothetical protein
MQKINQIGNLISIAVIVENRINFRCGIAIQSGTLLCCAIGIESSREDEEKTKRYK